MLEPALATWFTTEHHPSGASAEPWFDVIGSMVYPAIGHPAGATSEPWYQMRGDSAYPVAAHPSGPSREPELRVDAGSVYPVNTVPERSAQPWFVVWLRPD